MKKGDIWQARLNPVRRGGELKCRLVLIISGNLLNPHTEFVIACPLTTKIKNYHGNLILEPNPENGLAEVSEVLTSQVKSISKNQLTERMGSIAEAEMLKLHRTLNDLLRY